MKVSFTNIAIVSIEKMDIICTILNTRMVKLIIMSCYNFFVFIQQSPDVDIFNHFINKTVSLSIFGHQIVISVVDS